MGSSYRGCFLSLMGAVYFCAFLSYYVQYPGLLGEDGLLPARKFWEDVRRSRLQQVRAHEPLVLDLDLLFGWWTHGLARGSVKLPAFEMAPAGKAKSLRAFLQFPTWLWFLCDGKPALQVDQALEGIALGGAALAALAAAGVHHVAVFALLQTAYLTLYLLGQRWLGFQWDIFLLETGAMMLLYCPFASLRAEGPMPPAAWLLRALIVKFMYMNGVVKVAADCPTWKHLTALEYHFASTCLPTAEAWSLHQLPPLLLRLGVAAMFVAELAAPWLLLVPVRAVRRVGVAVQAALQLGILATGNYNWFNFHTMILLLPAWDDDDYSDSQGPLPLRLCTWLPRLWGRFWSTTAGALLGAAAACGVLAWSSAMMFELRPVGGGATLRAADVLGGLPSALADPSSFAVTLGSDRWRVDARYSVGDVSKLTDAVFSPRCLTAFFLLVAGSCARYSLAPLAQACGHRATGRPRLTTAVLALCRSAGRLAICSLVLPFLVLCLLPFEHTHRGAAAAIPFAGAAGPLEQALDPWQVSTGYGLFRRMTGVGRPPRGRKGWGGLPPSVVEVPAVVVEGSDDGATWREIPLRYAPGDPARQPRRTAPHQPRLDWQMWFAALGSYEHNPWFVHLLYKLLEGSDDTLALMDADEAPWPRAREPPRFVRAWLYHYDFTRLDTPWARSIPGTRILNTSRGADAGQWWSRARVREYVPAQSRDSLADVVRGQGWPVGKSTREAALRRAANCTAARRRGSATGRFCQAVVAARRWAQPIRSRVGWSVRSGLLRALWPAASDLFFLDVHFVLLMGPLLLIFGARGLGRLLCRRRSERHRAPSAAPSNKMKKE